MHPALTDIPIGSWVAAAVLDVIGGTRQAAAADLLIGVGVATAVPTAAAGLNDWSDTYGPETRVGLVHAAGNITALALYTASLVARWAGRRRVGRALSLAGLASTLGSAYLGGHLSFVRGVNVNHTAFETRPAEWTDVAPESEVTGVKPLRATAGGVPVMLVKQDGVVRALSATCTHAGGPLDEGTLVDGCVQCPWHGSEFRLDDGTVERGPASVPEPVWDVRIAGGRVSVRSRATT